MCVVLIIPIMWDQRPGYAANVSARVCTYLFWFRHDEPKKENHTYGYYVERSSKKNYVYASSFVQ